MRTRWARSLDVCVATAYVFSDGGPGFVNNLVGDRQLMLRPMGAAYQACRAETSSHRRHAPETLLDAPDGLSRIFSMPRLFTRAFRARCGLFRHLRGSTGQYAILTHRAAKNKSRMEEVERPRFGWVRRARYAVCVALGTMLIAAVAYRGSGPSSTFLVRNAQCRNLTACMWQETVRSRRSRICN